MPKKRVVKTVKSSREDSSLKHSYGHDKNDPQCISINSCFRRRGLPMKRLQFIIIGVVETITRVVVKVSAVD